MKNLKKLSAVIAAAMTMLACSFAFTGCELANNIQNDCNHSFVRQWNDSSLREATCTERGISEVYKCWKCQKFEFVYSPALPHTFSGTGAKVEINCKYSRVNITQTCTVCNQTVMNSVAAECHYWYEAAHYDAQRLTLVDIGVLSQEEYDSLSAEDIKSWEDAYWEQLNFSCEHTVYGCLRCNTTKTDYNHQYGEGTKEVIESTKAEAANGNCGITLGITCDTCREDERMTFHDFSEEVEELYSSSKYRIVSYKCTTCDTVEARVIYL